MHEARQRAEQANMSIRRVGSTTEFRVTFNEDNGEQIEKSAYYTDDLEDAMLTALAMRRKRTNAPSGASRSYDVVG